MRIAFQTGFRDAIADIQRTSEQMATAQRQVSTGRRIDVPSDDPSATTGAIGERSTLGAIDRYVRSADSVDVAPVRRSTRSSARSSRS